MQQVLGMPEVIDHRILCTDVDQLVFEEALRETADLWQRTFGSSTFPVRVRVCVCVCGGACVRHCVSCGRALTALAASAVRSYRRGILHDSCHTGDQAAAGGLQEPLVTHRHTRHGTHGTARKAALHTPTHTAHTHGAHDCCSHSALCCRFEPQQFNVVVAPADWTCPFR
jgi:hypothetical protein